MYFRRLPEERKAGELPVTAELRRNDAMEILAKL